MERTKKNLVRTSAYLHCVQFMTIERFYVKSGFLNQRQDEVRLYRIQDLTVTRSLSQRIFGMGTILVNSSDKTLGEF